MWEIAICPVFIQPPIFRLLVCATYFLCELHDYVIIELCKEIPVFAEADLLYPLAFLHSFTAWQVTDCWLSYFFKCILCPHYALFWSAYIVQFGIMLQHTLTSSIHSYVTVVYSHETVLISQDFSSLLWRWEKLEWISLVECDSRHNRNGCKQTTFK